MHCKKISPDDEVKIVMRVPRAFREALQRTAYKRSAALNKRITVKAIIMNAVSRDEDVIKEYGRLRTRTKAKGDNQ